MVRSPLLLAPVKSLADLRNGANSQQYSRIYEDQRPKILEDSEKSDSKENQDGGIGRHTVPPPTTRTDRKPNGKEV